ncbi:SDR family NAD(P)-dependent oxidoreductase [Streptomyces sp. NPDC088554]|uniref:SDR family NAD(P)-dependent oxidoreductase n=1 Tax=Streptomyces sp. NPDC088554 TaxID=3365865 RepID=UPI003800C2B4
MTITSTALVTAGTRGLGAAVAERFRADGPEAVALGLDGADIRADVTEEETLRRVADEIGPVDILVNSPGIAGPNKPLTETTPEKGRRVLDVNVLGTVNTMRILVPGMLDRGWGRAYRGSPRRGRAGFPIFPDTAEQARAPGGRHGFGGFEYDRTDRARHPRSADALTWSSVDHLAFSTPSAPST